MWSLYNGLLWVALVLMIRPHSMGLSRSSLSHSRCLPCACILQSIHSCHTQEALHLQARRTTTPGDPIRERLPCHEIHLLNIPHSHPPAWTMHLSRLVLSAPQRLLCHNTTHLWLPWRKREWVLPPYLHLRVGNHTHLPSLRNRLLRLIYTRNSSLNKVLLVHLRIGRVRAR